MQCENAMPELPTRCVLTFAWLLVCIVLIVLLVCWCQWVMCDMCPFVDGGLPWPLRTLSFLISRFCRPSSHYLSIRQPLIHLSLSLCFTLGPLSPSLPAFTRPLHINSGNVEHQEQVAFSWHENLLHQRSAQQNTVLAVYDVRQVLVQLLCYSWRLFF